MSTTEKTERVKISGEYAPAATSGEIKIEEWDKKARLHRALKYGGMCWGLALAAVPFPIVHFIFVPGFLIAGPIVFKFNLGQESVILGGEGECPYCQKRFPIIRTKNRFPFTDCCTHCRKDVKIEQS